MGTDITQDIMTAAARSLTDRELLALEAEIGLYVETGLVGVLMSRLLGLLRHEPMSEVA